MNAGTSTKMSMDYQQTASNQSSVSTGTRNIHDDADSLKHEGTTFMRNQDGELLRMTGNFEQTGGAWKFSGNVQNLSTGETYTGNMSGMAKDMNSMQQGLNVDDVSMTGKERANLGDVKGENVAFIQGTVVDSNLSASDVTHKDKITTSNNIDQNNNIKEAKIVEDYSKLKDTSDVTKNNTINENKYVEDSSTNIDNSYSEQAGQKLALGDEITGHGGARGVLKEGFSKYIGNSEDAEIAKDAFFNNLTQNQNAILSQSGSNKTAEELATSLRAYAKGEVSLGIGVPGGTGAKASLGVEAAIGASLRQVGQNATSADFNRIMNEQIFNNVSQQVAFGKIKAEDFDKALEQAYDAYNNVLKDIAKGTGSMNPYTETEGMVNMPTNPSKK